MIDVENGGSLPSISAPFPATVSSLLAVFPVPSINFESEIDSTALFWTLLNLIRWTPRGGQTFAA